MDARDFNARKAAALKECAVPPGLFARALPRLQRFMEPFVAALGRRERREHAATFVQGLVSDLSHRNAESIAYRFGLERMALQNFVGAAAWDDGAPRAELARQVGTEIGDPDGVIVFDPSGFPKSGRESVGVARQWCGRLGKTDNCQVAVFMGYVSRHEHALVDAELYLPKDWTQDRRRMKKAGVPAGTKFRTRHQLALALLARHGAALPHRWVTGDDEMGRPAWFRKQLRTLGERYLLAVPSNTSIRDLEVEAPAGSGVGRPPKRPWQSVAKCAAAQPESAWTAVDVRDGSKGPLLVEVLKRRVRTRDDQRRESADDELLAVIRYRDRDDQTVTKIDYYLSDAAPDVAPAELASAAKAEHRIEECLRRAKSEAGLADYEVRNWIGWQRHLTLSLLASWFLTTETLRGKKIDPGADGAADPDSAGADPAPGERLRHAGEAALRLRTPPAAQRAGAAAPLETP
jgi:SRSO17 transposase